jgi:type IV pilus assembly protein PilB
MIPFIDLQAERVVPGATELVPLLTLQRVIAIPISNAGDRLRIAIADPANVHGIDELRLASKFPVDIGVASRDDIIA